MTALLTENMALMSGAPNGIRRLRELVLELAVTGKLVAQNAADESGEQLLARIKVLRAAAGSPKKPDSADDLSPRAPAALPQNWVSSRLGDIVDIVRGITFPSNEKTKEPADGRIACLRTSNVQDAIEWGDLLFIDESFVGRADQLLKVSDIVMSMANSRELVGKVALVTDIPMQRASFGGFLGVIRPVLVEPRFVVALLRTPSARRALIDGASQTTNIANISLAKLRPLPVAVPPLAEQHRIVAKVDELMALCDRLEARQQDAEAAHAQLVQTLLDSLTQAHDADEFQASWERLAGQFRWLFDSEGAIEQLEQAIRRFAVSGRLAPRHDGEHASDLLQELLQAQQTAQASKFGRKSRVDAPLPPAPAALPEHWCWCRLSDVLDVRDGTHDTPAYHAVGVPLVTSKNLSSGQLNLDDTRLISAADHAYISVRSKVDLGDVLFAMIGSIGNPVVVDIDTPFSIKNVALFKHWLPGSIVPDYLVTYLSLVAEELRAAAAGGVQSFVSLSKLRNFPFALPPTAEQERIVAALQQLLQLCDQLKARIAAARAKHAQLAEALVAQAVAA